MAQNPKIFRHGSLYYGGKKVAYINAWEETISSGNEDQVGDEGWMGRSSGAKMTKLSCDAIIPVSGIGIDVIERMLNDQYIDIGLAIVNGKIHRLTMGIDEATITSSAPNGTLNGKFSFSGGKPELVG